jgi:hypothetical protein
VSREFTTADPASLPIEALQEPLDPRAAISAVQNRRKAKAAERQLKL